MRHKLLLVSLLMLFICIFSVSALPTRLNISMSEVVYNNVTYAKDFDLVEDNPFCEIHGTMNITNPNDDTVFDTYISFTNVDRMLSDFVWVDGRNGSMFSGGAALQEVVGVAIGSGANDYTMTLDLDNDDQTDYINVSNTHIIFQLSKEGNVSLRLNDDGVNVNLGAQPVDINMTEVNIPGASRSLGNLTVVGQNNLIGQLNGAVLNITINEYFESPIVIHIPELRKQNYTTFKYNITCANTDPPVDLQTNYSNAFHAPDTYQRKVLAGYNFTITQHAVNNFYLAMNVTNVNISIMAQTVDWNGSAFDFALLELLPEGDWSNVSGNGTSTESWWWAPNGGILEPSMDKNISYIVRSPYSVPFSATYMAILENISYDAPFLMSNLTILDINASADINKSFEKRIERPQDDLNNPNVTWEIRPKITVPINISYTLNEVTMWVSLNLNPNNYTGLNKSVSTVPVEINLTAPWGAGADYWTFNYTDGSNATNPPPIVWMKPEWLITNNYGQILNYSTTQNGNDLYMKYIYVVNGYWLQVMKNITSIGEDQYKIYVEVQNVGNGWTPENEAVTVYDFVPQEFAPWNYTDSVNLVTQTVGGAGQDYNGLAHRWNIPWEPSMNASLGPKNGPNATSFENYTWNVSYVVNGSGDYKASELYIVGLDPLKVDGASASPVISVISSLESHSRELIYIGIVAFLIVLNITNLVMTNRIEKKIDHATGKGGNDSVSKGK